MQDITLVIADPHEPASHPAYLDWCIHLWNKWGCTRAVFIGDMADNHHASKYGKRPGLPGPDEEVELAYEGIQLWYANFPEAKVLIGNHDERTPLRCEENGVSTKWLKWYAELWETPGWEWGYRFQMDDVQYLHGTGRGGQYPAVNKARGDGMSTVLGHIHTAGGCWWIAQPERRLFGLNVSCGIDVAKPNFDYEKNHDKKPLLGAGIVVGPDKYSCSSTGYYEPMPCARGERFHRSRFE